MSTGMEFVVCLGSGSCKMSRLIFSLSVVLLMLVFSVDISVKGEPFPKPQQFLDRLQAYSDRGDQLEVAVKYFRDKFVSARVEAKLKELEDDIRSRIDAKNSVVVVELQEFADREGSLLRSDPFILGEGSSYDQVLDQSYANQDSLRPRAFGKAYSKNSTHIYSYSLGNNGRLVRTGPLIVYGSTKDWRAYNKAAADAREQIRNIATEKAIKEILDAVTEQPSTSISTAGGNSDGGTKGGGPRGDSDARPGSAPRGSSSGGGGGGQDGGQPEEGDGGQPEGGGSGQDGDQPGGGGETPAPERPVPLPGPR
jgi:hypothetical protein